LPPKIFREHDPVLAAHVRAAEADAGYENLSLLYVAMTRAKRAMYLITQPVSATGTSRNFPRLLAATLGGEGEAHEVRIGAVRAEAVWSCGEVEWFRAAAAGAGGTGGARREARGIEPVADAVRVVRRTARRPSAEKRGALAAAGLFALERAAGAEFGTAVHELLAAVEWGSAGAAESFAAEWAARGEAGAEALACMRAEALRGVWERPAAARAEVWRERAFEIVLDGAWVTGVFDRVVVERDAAGRAVRAVVVDFKTDRVEDEAGVAAAVARHAGQLGLYRRVAARLTGLRAEAVAGELVLTRVRRRAAVPG
jgi:ATP-dependent helicase/nuclease subunit A